MLNSSFIVFIAFERCPKLLKRFAARNSCLYFDLANAYHIFDGLHFILLQRADLDNYSEFLFADGEGATQGFHIFGSLAH